MLVPDPAPVRPATPCPPWCAVGHDEPGDRFHYSEFERVGTIQLCLDLDEQNRATVEIRTGSSDGDNLDADALGALIERLTVLHTRLAATIAERTALHTAGGAA